MTIYKPKPEEKKEVAGSPPEVVINEVLFSNNTSKYMTKCLFGFMRTQACSLVAITMWMIVCYFTELRTSV